MIDFTTTPGTTVAPPTRIHPGECEECYGSIVGGRKRRFCKARCRAVAKERRACVRRAQRTPEQLDARHAQQAAWRASIPGLRSRYRSKRKGRLSGRQGYHTREEYLAAMARTNRRRRKSHRAWAHANQTRYAGTGLKPACVTCGDEVPWNGHGRPRDHCPVHDTARRR